MNKGKNNKSNNKMSQKKTKIIFLEMILRFMSSLILKRYRPQVVAITGSIGKTSAKEAIFCVLKSSFAVRKNEKNYNNEIGLPLTILGAETGGKSFVKWGLIFLKWLGFIFLPLGRMYPKVLVLEMGADRPGDIKYLTDFIHPTIGVITDISESHLEFFKNIEGVIKEKSTLVKSMSSKGVAILNADNRNVLGLKNKIQAGSVTFGFSQESQVKANSPAFNYDEGENIQGISFKLSYQGSTLPVRLNNILAKHQIYAALSAVAVGVEMGMNLVDATQALCDFSSPRGRMNLIPGIRNSLLIDDTYNASPASTNAAIETMGEIESLRKIVVLGDMLELGEETEEGHERIARKFLEIKGDIFLAVGKRMQFAVSELIKHNFNESNIFSFSNSVEAGIKLQEIIREGDLALIKGSQGARMEKVVEEVMANPESAKKLLCRQENRWKLVPVKNL